MADADPPRASARGILAKASESGGRAKAQYAAGLFSLIPLDLTPDESVAQDSLASLVNSNPWLIKYLLDGAEEADPNGDIVLVLGDDDAESDGADSGTGTESPSDPVADNPGNGNKK